MCFLCRLKTTTDYFVSVRAAQIKDVLLSSVDQLLSGQKLSLWVVLSSTQD